MIGYTLDKDNRRTQAALSDGSRWEYGYDPLNQLTSAERADSDGAALNAMSYRYDGIGNRTAAEEDGEAFAYASNQLNQYTAVNGRELTYDADGNTLTTDDGWLYTWNSENRLIRAEKGSVKFEAGYDYMGRRFEKKLYDGETLTVHRKFVYDGYKLIGVYDALNNDAEELAFVWQPETAGLDVPLSMKHDGNVYYYVTDGNKNVTALYDATGAEAANYVYGPFGQTLAANGRGGESPAAVDYEGGKVAAICNLLSCNGDEMHRPEDLDLDMLFCMELGGDSGIGGDGNASALRTVFGMEAMDRRQYGASTSSPLPPGGLALVNPFRFSSEFHDDELGLVYYNYRYYNPQLGRWTKRDPIGEEGGIHLYNIATNNIINSTDINGLDTLLIIVGEDSQTPRGKTSIFKNAANIMAQKYRSSSTYDPEYDATIIIDLTGSDNAAFSILVSAFKKVKCIRYFAYYGHGDSNHLFLTSSAGAGSNLSAHGGVKDPQNPISFNSSPLTGLSKINITAHPEFTLGSCRAGNSIASSFAYYFNAPVYASSGGVNYRPDGSMYTSWKEPFDRVGTYYPSESDNPDFIPNNPKTRDCCWGEEEAKKLKF